MTYCTVPYPAYRPAGNVGASLLELAQELNLVLGPVPRWVACLRVDVLRHVSRRERLITMYSVAVKFRPLFSVHECIPTVHLLYWDLGRNLCTVECINFTRVPRRVSMITDWGGICVDILAINIAI